MRNSGRSGRIRPEHDRGTGVKELPGDDDLVTLALEQRAGLDALLGSTADDRGNCE